MSETVHQEHLHKGHRARMKERFLREGLDGFAPHEVLELILFYAVPQKDTNGLAHRLLAHFGSLARVLRASHEELCRVEGVGEHVATLLRLWLPAASYALSREYESETRSFATVGQLGDYFINRYAGEASETVYLMLLDNRYGMINCARVYEGAVNSVHVTPRRLIELALRQNAAMAVLAHNHPEGIAIPSSEDIGTTASLRDAFEAVGIPLLEHILVAGNSYTPIMLRSNKTLAQSRERSAFYANYTLMQEKEK